jgi:ABC-type glycerol-3-phosphate transport system permease component
MIPRQTILEPVFLVALHLGLVNKIYGVVIILGSFGVAGSVFLSAAFIKAIPTEVTEGAQTVLLPFGF